VRAAELYSAGAPLTDAVIQVIKGEPVNAHHIQRTCEFANHAAYQKEWKKGGDVRIIEFDGGLADPKDVARALGKQAAKVPTMSDYTQKPTGKAKEVVREDPLEAAFRLPKEKVAAVKNPPDLAQLQTNVARLQNFFRPKLAKASLNCEEASRTLVREVRSAIMNGEAMNKIASAWNAVGDLATVKAAIDIVRPVCEMDLGEQGFEMELAKTASSDREPNPDHPLMIAFSEFEKTAKAYSLMHHTMAGVNEQSDQIKELCRAGGRV